MKYNAEAWMRRIGIPQDVLLNTPILEMQEFHKLHIVNYTGISELTDERIRISTERGDYIIDGKHLMVCLATHREMIVEGDMLMLTFSRKAELEA